MNRTTTNLAIVFASISGSSRLYDTLGNTVARNLISQCLTLMIEQVKSSRGTLIKTIGNEIMCTFEDARQAVESCIDMQEAIHEELPILNPNAPATMSLQIGLHFGSAILESGDVFGDAVNVAARMAGLAKSAQIITTRQTMEALPSSMQYRTRYLDRVFVKGKSDLVEIFEVTWQPEDLTRVTTSVIPSDIKFASLELTYREQVIRLDISSKVVILGRSQKADIMVNDRMASREHARIECRRDKFVLTDQSTNGTYVTTTEGAVYLRREETALIGHGTISFGHDINDAQEVVTFTCD